MANYASLKAAVADVIKTNGANSITAAKLQTELNRMIDSLGAGYQFMGVATTSTNPGTPDQKVFYLAATTGTYANFGGIVLGANELAVLLYSTNWTKTKVADLGTGGSGCSIRDVVEDGFFICDENGNVAFKVDESGLTEMGCVFEAVSQTEYEINI